MGKVCAMELFQVRLKATWCPLTSETVAHFCNFLRTERGLQDLEDNSQDVLGSFLDFLRPQPQSVIFSMLDISVLPALMTAKDCLTPETIRPPHHDKRSLRDCSF